MKDQLRRILNLVRKTGDTMIVTDPDGKDAYVVMDLDQYELFLGFSGEGLDREDDEGRVSDDIIKEKIQEKSNNFGFGDNQASSDEESHDIWDMMPPAGDDANTWDLDQLSEQERRDLEDQYQAFVEKNVQRVVDESPQIQQKQVENPRKTSSEDSEDEFGEEQFYLEPIE